jgi:hypothetical protein
MENRYFFPSLTRISNLESSPFEVRVMDRSYWRTGDYVAVEVAQPTSGKVGLELCSGRVIHPFKGDCFIGALGVRHATLEATGTWEKVQDDGLMHLLTGGGILGRLTSKSTFISAIMTNRYLGHVMVKGKPANMEDFVSPAVDRPFTTPTVLMVGTSMSAGKTTAGMVVVRELKQAGYKVLGAKLTGAGRLRDILALADAGADSILDFVDAGLPSTVVPKDRYCIALKNLLSRMASVEADFAVVEIGSSPLEPYNGATAIHAIREQIKCTILCASDPYGVYGVMKAYGLKPDLVTGVAANTIAGVELIEKLCEVPALNLINPETGAKLRNLLNKTLDKFI